MSTAQTDLTKQKATAAEWFSELRDSLCNAFEKLEDTCTQFQNIAPGRFKRETWQRGSGKNNEGGGEMSLLHGRVFEKAGIHISTVHGEFSEQFAREIEGASEDRRFWAAGISLIAHPRNPHVPAAHMNTRFVITTKSWFGGGADLTPMLSEARSEHHVDTQTFHAALKTVCDAHDTSFYSRFKEKCDSYFFLPHRNETRGTGGIFFDHHNTGDWMKDFAFTRDVGSAFLGTYPKIVSQNMNRTHTEEEREEQLVQRGRYAEFNLLYDRGTRFGLQTGGNVESILSSLPPVVKWP